MEKHQSFFSSCAAIVAIFVFLPSGIQGGDVPADALEGKRAEAGPAARMADEVASVPKQADALAQFTHAMMQYYFPASGAQGAAAEALCRKAVVALEAVRIYFPDSEDLLPLIESHFYQGMCHVRLGERRKAAEAFLAAFRHPLPGVPLDRNQADRATYHLQAREQLMLLLDVLQPAEREEVENEE